MPEQVPVSRGKEFPPIPGQSCPTSGSRLTLRFGQETTHLPLPYPRHLVLSDLVFQRQTTVLGAEVGLRGTCSYSVLLFKQTGEETREVTLSQGLL